MKAKYIIILLLVILALIFVLQNTQVVTIHLFFWTITMSHIIMIVGLLVIGFLVGLLIGRR